jgi:tryptophan-rich sensory protein
MSVVQENPRPRRWHILLLLLALVFAVSALGSWVTVPKIPTWYASLTKPSFNPPSWVFGPVWTVLYAAMAVAAWRVWIAPADEGQRSRALMLFWAQLALNAAWSPLFFGLERPGLAFVVILAMVALIAATMVAFFRIDRSAGWLFVPYLAWVSFAAVLNGAIYRLN